jgi:hypothetical protein
LGGSCFVYQAFLVTLINLIGMKLTTLFIVLLAASISLLAQKPGKTAQSAKAAQHDLVKVVDSSKRPDSTVFPMIWRVRDRELVAGNTENIDFLAFNFNDITTYQFALRFDPTQLRFEAVEALTTAIPIDPDGNFGLYNVQAGEIRSIWSGGAGLSLPPATPVFRLRFAVLAGGEKLSEVLGLDPTILYPIGYNPVLAARPIELSWADYLNIKPREQQASVAGTNPILRVLQNYPNPFVEKTIIGFELPEACEAHLRILDNTGQELLRISDTFPAGYTALPILLSDIGKPGALFYQLTTPFGSCSRIMLALAP